MGRLLKMGRKMVGKVQDDGRRGQRWCTGNTGERAVPEWRGRRID